ncbi:MAG: DUF1287 domain-containing protein [Planctomycetes bacterium]|nr:DUF1287 domain-containing protein [Planctomycetota bacterium]
MKRSGWLRGAAWVAAIAGVFATIAALQHGRARPSRVDAPLIPTAPDVVATQPVPAVPDPGRLATAAAAQIGVTVGYDPSYVRLAYPGGDVPADRGVCSDVVVRACRAVGIDLQRALHEDMAIAFAAYPRRWNLTKPDRNIDHRRVLNLMTWFERRGWSRPISADPRGYAPGDIVAWDLGASLTHIGVVVDDGQGGRAIVHNIGAGAQREAVLFAWRQIGHYRLPGAVIR